MATVGHCAFKKGKECERNCTCSSSCLMCARVVFTAIGRLPGVAMGAVVRARVRGILTVSCDAIMSASISHTAVAAGCTAAPGVTSCLLGTAVGSALCMLLTLLWRVLL
jgi:hypothetical protein